MFASAATGVEMHAACEGDPCLNPLVECARFVMPNLSYRQPTREALRVHALDFVLVSYRTLDRIVSGFSGGRVKQHPIANPNRHGGEAFGVRTTWGWVQ